MNNMERYLILGSKGMLGKALVKECINRNFFTFEADIQSSSLKFNIKNDNSIIALIKKTKPTVVINTVAIVNLKRCDESPDEAYLVNARPAAILASLSKALNFKFIHISTDHFFCGNEDKKHSETASVTLLNEYARSKYVAELFALINPESLVVRTNIVGFRNTPERPTFIEWLIKSLKENMPLHLFNDYYTSSIDVTSFSKILLDLISLGSSGIINIASPDVSSKKSFVEAFAKELCLYPLKFTISSIKKLPNGPRAESLGLDVSYAEKLLGYQFPKLEQVVKNLVHEYRKTNEIQH